jgi:sRNA-binding carbon storage regulator CsrA
MPMLILSPGEALQIGADVTLRLLPEHPGFSGGPRARLGLDAPRSVVIDRLEVHLAKQAELARAAEGGEP